MTLMTLDEAIAQLEDTVFGDELGYADAENAQITEWLKELRALQAENAELKRLLKLAAEDMQYFTRNDFEPSWKCEICEKFVKSSRRCEKMSDCDFAWYKLKECEQICKGNEHWSYLDEAKGLIEDGP